MTDGGEPREDQPPRGSGDGETDAGGRPAPPRGPVWSRDLPVAGAGAAGESQPAGAGEQPTGADGTAHHDAPAGRGDEAPRGPFERPHDGRAPSELPVRPQRYGRYVGLLALLILVLITVNTIVTKPNGASGVAAGEAVPPFAVPLATSTLRGDADVATHANDGSAGRVAACDLRGPRILNVCQLYERAPVVLALFVDGGSCPRVLSNMQALLPSFPGVRFAAVAIRGDRGALRRLVRSRALTFPIGVDEDGALAALYKIASCPQTTFVLPGGAAEGTALLSQPSPALLRSRTEGLVAAAKAAGWREPKR